MKTKQSKQSRCTECVWVHEADSSKGTSFQGVGLCPLHASASDLLEAAKLALPEIVKTREYLGRDHARYLDAGRAISKLRAAIAKAEVR